MSEISVNFGMFPRLIKCVYHRYPDEVVITDETLSTPADGSSATPAGEPGDDFFSSWDKPSIKRPSNPPSRSGTPPVVSRTASPFLSAGGANGSAARPKSPLIGAGGNDSETALPAPTAIRTTSSSAIRKGPTGGAGAKRTNVLGAKKTQKLGAKKVVGEEIDFEAAEKAAKAEAERIEKLGYDPEAEKAEDLARNKSSSFGAATKETNSTSSATSQAGPASSAAHTRSPSEVERLGMGMGRLGFGQIGSKGGAGAASSTAPAPKKLGFGSVGASKAPVEGEFFPPRCFPLISLSDACRPILTNHFFIKTNQNSTRARNSGPKRAYRPTSFSAAVRSTPTSRPRPRRAFKGSRARRASRPTPTLGAPRTT